LPSFLWEQDVCKNGCFGRLVVDGGPENKLHVVEFTKRYGIVRVQVSEYHAAANGMVERGHKPIVNALAKLMSGGLGAWATTLPGVLFARRTTVHQPVGHTPFWMEYGREVVLPIEIRCKTWRVLEWEKAQTRADLLARDEEIEDATLRK
jgi:hypothetical protein